MPFKSCGRMAQSDVSGNEFQMNRATTENSYPSVSVLVLVTAMSE